MIDAHKYNGQARAVIYGDAEQCLSITAVCLENRIKPVLIATGAENARFKTAINNMLAEKGVLTPKAFSGDEKPVILDDTDFETIEKYAVELGANMLIGNSDGRRIEEKCGIDLVRIGFPIHDRVGGQRKHYTGYFGTTALIGETANTILAAKERTYRKTMYERFYREPCVPEKRQVLAAEATAETHDVPIVSMTGITADQSRTGIKDVARTGIKGGGIFKCESGIHADGLYKNPRLYEPYPPELAGSKGRSSSASIREPHHS